MSLAATSFSIRTSWAAAALVTLLGGLLAVACFDTQGSVRPNIVLITIDTLRADHLTPYRHRRDTSPFLGELARESILFEDVISQCGTTPQSLSSLMTGLYPYTDGILRQNGPFIFLKRGSTSLAASLSAEGYRTHAITSSIQSARVTGIDLGFTSFNGIRVLRQKEKSRRRTAGEVSQLANDWLASEAGKSRPFFLWLHYLDPHHPYSPPRVYDKRFIEDELRHEGETRYYRFDEEHSDHFPLTDQALRDLVLNYDREIAYADDALRVLFETGLAPILDDSIVIFTADHGEALGEHGIVTHNELYHSIVRVPLMIRLPRGAHGGRTVSHPVMLVDIFPTVLDLLGLADGRPLRGRSLVPLLTEEAAEDKTVWRQRLRLAEYQYPALYSGGFKLIERPRQPELYDLSTDPAEVRDLSQALPEQRRALLRQLAELRRRNPGAPAAGDTPLPEVTPEMRRELEALGYVND